MGKRAVGLVGALGLVVVLGVAGSGVAAGKHTRTFTQTSLGAEIKASGTSFQSAYKVQSSLDGNGAAVQVGKVSGTAFPLSGSSTTTSYFADGVSHSTQKFKLGRPDAKGISSISGSGKCLGGTRVHKAEKCSFTLTGSFNTKTTVAKVKATGTGTR